MVLLSHLFSALACTALYSTLGTVTARQIDRKHIQALQREASDRFHNRLSIPPAGGNLQLSAGVKNFTFSNPAASGECGGSSRHSVLSVDDEIAFYVDGTTIPEVDWDVGPSWAGLLPISGDKDETRKVSAFYTFALATFSIDAKAPS